MMTTCILHGGFNRKQNTLNESFYKEIASHTPEEGTVLYVYFATEVESEIDVRYREHQGRILAHSRDKHLKSKLATREAFTEQLKGADTVLINGGDPVKLMSALHAVPNIEELLRGKTLAGSSAGAYALSSYYYSLVPIPGVYQGLGIAPVRVVCHLESETPERVKGEDAIALLDRYPHELELVVLRDYEWKTITV
jgi:peptidase E